ncbi:ribonuclease H-like protein [Auriscalpium vulgare]|uniref:Ribonuclease H-like protein n=1 Tax=Auriscalpium vulgare TaxID=40419 RepID=A0ACB8SCT5_9AGAM|nr:ribonuclease H-like protein [Auriscalpium vulgare]
MGANRGRNNLRTPKIVYTDGSCTNNGKLNSRCGSGVWFGHDHPDNLALRIGGTAGTNQIGEIAAIVATLQHTDEIVPLRFRTDSESVMKGLTENLEDWENRGWIGVANAEYFQAAAYQMRIKSATVTFQWVKGHSGNAGNDGADEQADRGARKNRPDRIDLYIPPEWRLTGAKLATITQSIAYRGIRLDEEKKHPDGRSGPKAQLDRARDALESFTGYQETNETLWKGINCTDIRKNIQTFLYRAYQQSYKLGEFWIQTPMNERAVCGVCNDPVESLEHILLECESDARDIIWTMARDLWPHGDDTWPDLSLGIILATGNLVIEDQHPTNEERGKKRRQGPTRLLKILISESAHLIWVLRCERAIAGKVHTRAEIQRRWTRKINDRISIDRLSARLTPRKGKQQKPTYETWKGTLEDEDQAAELWANAKEVLVGIRKPRVPP